MLFFLWACTEWQLRPTPPIDTYRGILSEHPATLTQLFTRAYTNGECLSGMCPGTQKAPTDPGTQETPGTLVIHNNFALVFTQDTPAMMVTQVTSARLITPDTPTMVATQDNPRMLVIQETPDVLVTQQRPSTTAVPPADMYIEHNSDPVPNLITSNDSSTKTLYQQFYRNQCTDACRIKKEV